MEISPTPPCPRHELAVNLLPDWSGLVGYVLSRPAASRTLPADHAAVLGAARPRPLRSRWSQPLGSPSVLFRAGGSMPNTVTVATQAVRNGWAVSSAGAQSELCPQRPGGLLDCRRGEEETPQSRGAETASWSSGAPLKAVTLLMGHRSPSPTPRDPDTCRPPRTILCAQVPWDPWSIPEGHLPTPCSRGGRGGSERWSDLPRATHSVGGQLAATRLLPGWAPPQPWPLGLDRGAPPRRPLWQCPARPADPAAPLGLLPLFLMSRSLVPRPWSLVMKLRWD